MSQAAKIAYKEHLVLKTRHFHVSSLVVGVVQMY